MCIGLILINFVYASHNLFDIRADEGKVVGMDGWMMVGKRSTPSSYLSNENISWKWVDINVNECKVKLVSKLLASITENHVVINEYWNISNEFLLLKKFCFLFLFLFLSNINYSICEPITERIPFQRFKFVGNSN